MESQYREKKWSSGERYKRTPRTRKVEEALTHEDLKTIAVSAQQQSLLSEDAWSSQPSLFLGDGGDDMNHREDSYNRMAEREIVGQVGKSPFMNNDYSNDISIQDTYLKPMSTSFERNSNKSSEEPIAQR